MNDHSESSTLPLEDDVPELPDDEKIVAEDSFVTPVSLIALNPSYASIALCGRKTVMGRNATKCSNGALLTGNTISGVHCEITSRSLEDMDAPIWIKDVSTNGVWVNGTKLNRDEATKISNKDIISFAAGAVDSKADAPVFMLIDKRDKSTFRNQQKEQTKRANDQLGIDPPTEEPEPEHKKQKTDGPSADNDSTKDKEEEDSAFEKEFECGICHEIMHKPVVLQPCLHSFCKECCKAWFRNSSECPFCRQRVTRTKRDFRLNNLIELFVKSRPHMARDDVEEGDGVESDSSDVVRHRRNNHGHSDDDHGDDVDEDEDEYSDDEGNYGNPHPLNFLFNGYSPSCPCCDPNNNIGYVCPDGVRLGPLPPNAVYNDFLARRQPQPGHSQCRHCQAHIPIIPQTAQRNIGDKFRCKMCHIPSCGCRIRSIEDNIAHFAPIAGYLNTAEERVVSDYLSAERLTVQNVWEDIKQGMDDGRFHYLRTSTAPSSASVSASASVSGPSTTTPSTATTDNNSNGNSTDNSTSDAAAASTSTVLTRAEEVTTSDKLCHACARDFLANGPLYQWRKNLDPTKLPPRVTTREDCWYGRECRTQFNRANPAHAERLNHICEKRPARS